MGLNRGLGWAIAALTFTAQPGWALPGQTVNLAESWIRNNPTLKPALNERLIINRLVAPGQRFNFQASVFPVGGVVPGPNRRQIRTERFSLVDHANPITVERLDESLRAIYGQEIFNDYRQAEVLLRYPPRGARPAPPTTPTLCCGVKCGKAIALPTGKRLPTIALATPTWPYGRVSQRRPPALQAQLNP
jgi:hypothetical protein